jgi:2',3'-cyclic-nucleotide 2'-phosphodiesterase/3'-nucleotidase
MTRLMGPLVWGLLTLGSIGSAATQDTAHVVVVATTDVHGRAYHWDYLNDREAPLGLTRVATVVDSLRARYMGQVVVIDAGDLIQGNPFATYFATERVVDPHPVVDALNAVGFDVATPGNHEFDFGVATFQRAVSGAAFPIVSANVYRLPRDTLVFPPYVKLQRDGVQVGLTGFTTPGVMVWNQQKLADRVLVRRPLPAVERALRSLEAEGTDLRIVIAHSGMSAPASYDTIGVGLENEAARLAELPVPPHLVIVGHTHRHFADSVIDAVHFVQPTQWARSVAVAHVWLVRERGAVSGEQGAERRPFRVVRIEGEEIPLAGVAPHPLVAQRLERSHQSVRLWVMTPLARISGYWSAQHARAGDSPIIDFVNEVQRRTAGADLSATAAFNTRARFGPGAVRLSDVAAIYPYENTLRAVTIDGAALKEYLEQSTAYFRSFGQGDQIVNDSIPGYNFDIVSGVDYVIDLTQPVGSRIRQLVRGGRLVQPTDSFTLALNSYRQQGGGGFDMLRGLPVVYDREENIRDLLADWIRNADTLVSDDYFTPSWSIVPAAAAEAVRNAFGPPEAVPPPAALLPVDSVTPAFAVPDTARRESPTPVVPVAHLKFPLEPSDQEHALGRLIADGYRNGARTQFALVLNESIRGGVRAGPIARSDLEAVFSEVEPLVRLAVTGQVVLEALELVVASGTPSAHVAGLEVWYDPDRASGRRVRRVQFPDGREVRRSESYTIALAASVAGGAEDFGMFVGAQQEPVGMTDLEALLSYLPRLRQPVEAPATARFHTVR